MASDTHSAPHSATAVATAFARQYYTKLCTDTEGIGVYYKDESQLTLFDDSVNKDLAGTVTGAKAIADMIQEHGFKDGAVYIQGIDAQSSLHNTYVIMTTGDMVFANNVTRRFSQTFILAPAAKAAYYVHNDLFRFLKEDEEEIEETTYNSVEEVVEVQAPAVVAPEPAVANVVTPEPEPEPVAAVPEVVAEVTEKIDESASVPASAAAEEAIAPAAAPVPETAARKPTGPPAPKTFASILGGKAGAAPAPAAAPQQKERRQAPAKAAAPAATQAAVAAAPAGAPAGAATKELRGPGLFINGVPSGVTSAELENLFATRLPAQYKLQKANVRDDKGFGFVDLPSNEAVKWCLDNGPWIINGTELKVEEKRPERPGPKRDDGRRGSGSRGRGGSDRGRGRGGRGGHAAQH